MILRRRWWVVAVLLVALGGVGFLLRPVSFLHCLEDLRNRLQGMEEGAVLVEGYRVHYDLEGSAGGPAVVLVHGLGGRAEDWHELAPYFVRAGYRVYMPDLPGFGRSERPAKFSYSVRDQAAVVVGFLDVMGLKQVDLCGWSMGGWIAQKVAIEHPERVRRLVLLNSAGLARIPAWNLALFTPTTPAELDELFALLMPDPPRIPWFMARDIVRRSEQNAWVIQRALRTMKTLRDTTDSQLSGLQMPVLLVWGTEDRITPISHGEAMQRLIPRSELDRIDGCGHLAPDQCAGEIGPKVVEFLRR